MDYKLPYWQDKQQATSDLGKLCECIKRSLVVAECRLAGISMYQLCYVICNVFAKVYDRNKTLTMTMVVSRCSLHILTNYKTIALATSCKINIFQVKSLSQIHTCLKKAVWWVICNKKNSHTLKDRSPLHRQVLKIYHKISHNFYFPEACWWNSKIYLSLKKPKHGNFSWTQRSTAKIVIDASTLCKRKKIPVSAYH